MIDQNAAFDAEYAPARATHVDQRAVGDRGGEGLGDAECSEDVGGEDALDLFDGDVDEWVGAWRPAMRSRPPP
ncbi:hypothetical protein [Curtobacterium sp. MCPF17_018]|uniref:hypothetical protein n=1 Tax=Curtobacterium sp. MCPF17_018 TaxID=2175638 RepID=UPI0021AC5F4F|nr:hypothetical protein [Curtobacterium sp. MCPF17_018]